MKYTFEVLSEAAAKTESISGVLRLLGLKRAGGNFSYISRRLKELEVDTSHFTGQAHGKGRPSPGITHSAATILVLRPSGSRREYAKRLRRAMIEIGMEYRCACGQGPEWQGQVLVLHVDHKDGNWLDNRPENVRFLCPNCHSQTVTFGSKNGARGPTVRKCSECGTKISARAKRCNICAGPSRIEALSRVQRTRIEWPDVEMLLEMTKGRKVSAVARKLGVSDTAVRKHLQLALLAQ